MSKVLKNTTAYVLSGLIPSLMNLLLLPLYTRFLEPADFGIVSLVTALVAFLETIVGLKIAHSMNRLYFDYEGPELKSFFSTILYGLIIINTALFAALHSVGEDLTAWIFPGVALSYRAHILPGLVVLFCSSFRNYFFFFLRVREKGGVLLSMTAVNTILGLSFGLFFVVYQNMGAEGLLLSMACASATSVVFLAVGHFRYLTVSFRTDILKGALAYSLPIIPYSLGGVLFLHADRYVASLFIDTGEIGLYDLAVRISMVFMLLIRSFQTAVAPEFMRRAKSERDNARAYLKLLLPAWAAAAAGGMLFAGLFAGDALRLLLPLSYHGAAGYIPVLLPGYVLMGLYGFTMYSVIYEKKTGAIAIITLVAGAVSIGLNLLLLPGRGMMAAAWVKLLSSALTLCLGWFYSQRCLPLDFKWRTTASIVVPAILLLFIANLFGSNHGGVDLLLRISLFATFVFLLLRTNRGFVKGILASLGETRSVIAEEIE